MFISLSKTIGKVGGFRIGVGTRITKKNTFWAAMLILCISLFQLMWYMLVLMFWLLYAMGYGLVWLAKFIIKKIQERNVSTEHTIDPE